MTPAARRVRFAWWPIKEWRTGPPNHPTGRHLWMRYVVETFNVWDGWMAFEHNN